MAHVQEPIEALPLWQTLNSVVSNNTQIAAIPGKGSGLVAVADRPGPGAGADAGPLIFVPEDLVLCAGAVEQYAKENPNFRLLFDALGQHSPRGDVLLFLLVQLVVGSRQPGEDLAALPAPWTDYVKFLPAEVPLPTTWTDEERLLLHGTSLETAVRAKMIALEREFERLRELSSDMPFWHAAFWERKIPLHQDHWFLVDAWYRSRCLELPRYGPSMVPCIDMVNHSSTPNAYYQETTPAARNDAGVVLLTRPQERIAAGSEITISYTGSTGSHALTASGLKPASEMLFNYGFIDPESVRHSLVLPVQPLPDDPLAKAKLHVFGDAPPRLEIERPKAAGGNESDIDDDDDDGTPGPANGALGRARWTCPFVFLMCVNEEDGLDFRLRQETDGSTQLRMFWQDSDVTDSAADFETLTNSHKLAPVFRLRVVTVLQEMIESHLERMQSAGGKQDEGDGDDSDDDDGEDADDDDDDGYTDGIRSAVAKQAAILRDVESRILCSALETLEVERADLLSNATVVAYLGSMDISQNCVVDQASPNQEKADEAMHESEDDDFS